MDRFWDLKKDSRIYMYTYCAWPKVVRLSGWSHSKVPLYWYALYKFFKLLNLRLDFFRHAHWAYFQNAGFASDVPKLKEVLSRSIVRYLLIVYYYYCIQIMFDLSSVMEVILVQTLLSSSVVTARRCFTDFYHSFHSSVSQCLYYF